MRRAVLAALLAGLAAGRAAAAENVGTTGAQFLRTQVGGRPAGLGGAYAALADDVWALHYNPGGLGLVPRSELGLMYEQRELDIDLSQGGIAVPLGGTWTLGASALRLGTTDTRRGALGLELGTFEVEDLAVSGGVGFRWGSVGIGAVGRYVRSRLDDRTASTGMADIGVLWRYSDRLSVGAAIQHIGGRLRFDRVSDPLPRTVRVGAAVRLFDDRLMLTGDAIFVRDLDARGAIGGEFRVAAPLVVRAGLRLGGDRPTRERYSLGLGLTFGAIDLDYAFSPVGLLGAEHRVSLAYGWGEVREIEAGGPILRRPRRPPAAPPPPPPPSPPPPAAPAEVPAAPAEAPEAYVPPFAAGAEFEVSTVRGTPDGGVLAPILAEAIRNAGRGASVAPAPAARWTVEPIVEFRDGRVRASAIVADRRTGAVRLVMADGPSQTDAVRALGRRIGAGPS